MAIKDLIDTTEMMCDQDYKERFKAEYWQTKIRYEKLKKLNTKIEAAREMCCNGRLAIMPNHDCPDSMLNEQQNIMGHYLHILEVRAEIEGIEL